MAGGASGRVVEKGMGSLSCEIGLANAHWHGITGAV